MQEADWADPTAAWWAKHHQAQTHQAHLVDLEATYTASEPFRVEEESTDDPNVTQFRFRQAQPIPITMSLVLGDIVHNLRSALDSLTFAMVSEERGRALKEREERACQFPICQTPQEFEHFMRRYRSELYGEAIVSALRACQPFYWLEQAKSRGVQNAELMTYEADSPFHHLSTLNRLSNIDKHRRLTVTALWPSLLYWTKDDDTSEQQYSWVAPPPWQDGDVVGRMHSSGNRPKQVIHQLVLVALDDPARVKNDTATHGLGRETNHLCSNIAMTMRTAVSRLVHWHMSGDSAPPEAGHEGGATN